MASRFEDKLYIMSIFKKLLVLLLIISPMVLLAQSDSTTVEVPYFKFILAFVLSTLLALFTNAIKWIGTNKWDSATFFQTILLPWILSIGGGVVLVSIDYFAPFLKNYLMVLGVDGDYQLNYGVLYSIGFTLAVSIKKLIDKAKN